MIRLILTLTVVFFVLELSAQVLDLSNAKNERKIDAVAYDSSYIVPNYSTTKEMKAGLVGQEITILKISSEFNVNSIDGNYATYSDKTSIEGKIWKIIEFINEGYDGKYKISNSYNEWILSLGSTDVWFINAGLNSLKKELSGKSYVSFRIGLKLNGVDDATFNLDGVTPIKITDVQYAKLSSVSYSVVLFFDNGLISEFGVDRYSASKKNGWIKLGGRYGEDDLVEVSTIKEFTKTNSKYIEKMRKGEIAIGMSEYQTRLAWGLPTTSYTNIAGFDKVNQYGKTGNSRNLYFIKDVLKLIK